MNLSIEKLINQYSANIEKFLTYLFKISNDRMYETGGN